MAIKKLNIMGMEKSRIQAIENEPSSQMRQQDMLILSQAYTLCVIFVLSSIVIERLMGKVTARYLKTLILSYLYFVLLNYIWV